VGSFFHQVFHFLKKKKFPKTARTPGGFCGKTARTPGGFCQGPICNFLFYNQVLSAEKTKKKKEKPPRVRAVFKNRPDRGRYFKNRPVFG
jgi:hypothetical protein